MRTDADIPVCEWCNEPLPPAKRTGRRRRYCPEPKQCRLHAFRQRHLTAIVDGEAVDLEPAGEPGGSAQPPLMGNVDEDVAQTLLQMKGLAGRSLLLGRHARPQIAWRMTELGNGVLELIEEYFEEVVT